MRKTILYLQAVLVLLIVGCDNKPPVPTATPPATTNAATTNAVAPASTNEQAAAEEQGPDSKVARGEHAIAVTVNEIATKAALEAMKKGGNAIDGAVTAALTLGVVDAHNSGIGGGCFILIRRANGAYNAIDGREMAPGNAKRDMFIRDGKADTEMSQLGPLAAATPGALAAYDLALKKFGKLPIKEHLLAAAKIADEGFPVSKGVAAASANVADELRRFPEAAKLYLKDGKPLKAGDKMKNADLASTYRQIATNGTGWFYDGPFAKATGDWMKENGGIMTALDFKNYQAVFREPIFSNYRGYTVATMPPPSSGGVHVIQILKILEPFDLYTMRREGADVIHVISESMKLAFADRAYWLGDPDYVKVPKGLISKKYCRDLATKIQTNKVIEVAAHGTPDKATEEVFDSIYGKQTQHTTHFAVADSEGNWVACTATINTSFGSKVVIPGTGVVLNNEMDDFSAQPGVPNFFGLVGAEANAVGPFKRPLSSMSPTILEKEGQVILAVGAAGGPTIISQVSQAIINYVDMRMQGGPEMVEMDMSIYDALRTPRFHQQWRPNELKIENSWAPKIMEDLEKKGHKLNKVAGFGACQMIARAPEGKGYVGAADPRGEGKALGY